MLTPAFTISQDEEFVTVVIKCPYIKAQEVEFFINDTEFKFYVRPYFLRLTFPASIIEDGREKASYNVDRGEITVLLPKATRGEEFPDLDLITKLMASKSGPPGPDFRLSSEGRSVEQLAPPRDSQKPLIEVIGESPVLETDGNQADSMISDEIEEEFNWDYPQEVPLQPELQTGARYGFNNAYSGYGTHVEHLTQEILDITHIDTSTPSTRKEARIAREDAKFDDEYFMADFVNDEEIQRLIKFRPDFWKALKRIQKAKSSADPGNSATAPVSTPEGEQNFSESAPGPSPASAIDSPWLTFTEEEQERMRQLPNKEYLLDNGRAIYLGLVDIVYAYCYNYRTTEGESTVESPWTIAKLSSTLSCFDTFSTLRETLIASIRRTLAYPLHRHFALSLRCIEDTAILFKLGKRALLKVLLEVNALIGRDDRMYVLSTLWLTDYCVWIQRANDKMLQSLASELNHISISKQETGWPLEELEQVAQEVTAELDEEERDSDSMERSYLS
ncbi:Hsp90 cochaperone SHQ1 [Spizellomyces punctatus DAOM BR117]|uniref:CS domain-containing protein n=1 Tax=Spizellomyces punctatus (strain DAOM BR117) TaxID=645134 RepID=A0A0L0HU49_SPIPD|nr:Hsp90 cochaperone SHQ1 [Spizellomyces punctatus DAOM BR117]KND04881.1 hypothetical protein SPPG_00579 [Spizellomyces punctatus DAOM BR117]|eukprot:XP_016612920.1 hypothetical protein SPPG_00579 [Spizellomyces punctatus DAOM BR117]